MESLVASACNLATCVGGVASKPVRAVLLFRRVIGKGSESRFRKNLAHLLEDGVGANPEEAGSLYQRAINDANDIDSMFNLAALLHQGANGVATNHVQAVSLYRHAIDEGGRVDAMGNLVLLLRCGRENVPRDVPQAVHLLRSDIEIENRPHHMYILACTLFSEDSEDLRNPVEEKPLLEQCIQTSNLGPALLTLGALLQTGDEGIARDARRPKHCSNLPAVTVFGKLVIAELVGSKTGQEERKQLQS